LKDRQIDLLSRENESLSLRALDLEEKLRQQSTELESITTRLQQQTKLNDSLQHQLADKTTQIELMVKMFEEQVSASKE
jgi:uncharacterized protein YigA (DUF484 family)